MYLRRLALALLLSSPAFAQTYTTASATTIQNGSGGLLNAGVACLTPLNSFGTPVAITPSGQSAELGPFCSIVTAGAFSNATIPNLATAAPSGLLYTLQVTSALGPTVLSVGGVAITGSTFTFDTYIYQPPAYTTGPTAFGLGIPYSACVPGATYTRTNASAPTLSGWACQPGGSGNIWVQQGQGQTPYFPTSFMTAAQVTQMIANQTGGSGGGGLNQLTGDGSAGPGTGSQAFTLATVNSSPGTFGDSTHTARVVVNGKGLATGVTSVALALAALPSNCLVYGLSAITSRCAVASDLAALGVLPNSITGTSAGLNTNGTANQVWGMDAGATTQGWRTVSTVSGTPNFLTTSVTFLGDSIPAGAVLGDPATESYPALIAQAIGVPLNNYAIPGDQAADIFRTQIYPNSVTSSTDAAPLAGSGVGTNDADLKGVGPYETVVFIPSYEAVATWMLIPSQYKVLVGSAGVAVTGTCSNTPNSGVFGAGICSGSGTMTFTTPSAGTLVGFWYYVNDTLTGTNFTYSVDGGSFSPSIPGGTTPAIATQNGGVATILWQPLAGLTPNTVHTVTINAGSGPTAFLGVGLVPPVPYYQHQIFGMSDIPNQKTPVTAPVPTQLAYTADIQSVVNYVRSIGLDGRMFPSRSYMLGTAAEMSDGLHPNYPLGTTHMKSSFMPVMQPVSSACSSNCTLLGMTTLNSGVSTPSIIKSNASSSPSVFMQNTNTAGFAGIQFLDTAGGQQGGIFLAGSSNTFYPGYVGLFTNSVPVVIGDIFHGPGTAAIEIAYPTQVPKFNYGLLGQTVAPTGACGSGGLAGSLPGEFVLSQDGAVTYCSVGGTWVTVVRAVSATAPTQVAGAAAGVSPTCSSSPAGTNVAGVISCTTGTVPTTGTLLTITFNGTLPVAPQGCSLMARNTATSAAASNVHTTAPSTTTWAVVADVALVLSTTYVWSYQCQ